MRAWLLIFLAAGGLTGCGGDDSRDGDPPQPPVATPLPLPPAGTSRWAAVERDDDGDGLAEAITRYEYDSAGRRTAAFTWRAQHGASVGEPVVVQRWTHDSLSRLLSESLDNGTRFGYRIEATYGSNGLLASTRKKWQDSATWEETRYIWQGQRMVEFGRFPGGTPHSLSYDSDGRVVRVEWQGEEYDAGSETYAWRADGQLLYAVYSSESVFSYALTYDDAGRLLGATHEDDAVEWLRVRYFHDARGRLERVETESGGLADSTYRLRWEDGLCQPVYRLGPPPENDPLTDQAHADGTTFGCAT